MHYYPPTLAPSLGTSLEHGYKALLLGDEGIEERPTAPHRNEDLLLGHGGVPREGLFGGGITSRLRPTVAEPACSWVGWRLPSSQAKRTVIALHGHRGARHHCVGIAAALWRRGANVLLFDDRGRGFSEGKSIKGLRASSPTEFRGPPSLGDPRRLL